jgi:tight adherence protein B
MSVAGWISEGEVLLQSLLALMLAGTMLALAVGPSGSSRRLKQRIARTTTGAGASRPPRASEAPASVRRQESGMLLGRNGRALVRLLPRSEALRRRLDQAGLPLNPADYMLVCVLCGVVLAIGTHFGIGAPWSIASGVGIIAASGVPQLLVAHRIKQRRRQFLGQFPDAIDLIVRGVRSGLPVAEALQAAGHELPNQVGTLFREVTGNLKLGKTLDESLAMAARTLDIQEFKFFIISLTIQQETGGNLSEILQNLGILMRRREQVKLKIKAMSSEARASAMIIGSLPFVMFGVIYIVDPEYIMKLFVDPRGWMLLAGGLTSLGLGLGIMAKMIRFEIRARSIPTSRSA